MSQKKILVIDDDPDVRLKANSYDVILAEDGVASIEATRKHNPDLIVLDLGLPAGDGFSVLERLRTNINMSSIPVIVVSGRDRHPNRTRALEAGAYAFLQKPVDNAQLLSVIGQALEEIDRPRSVVYDLGARDSSTARIPLASR
jgi:two-component system OmpR family response regulator